PVENAAGAKGGQLQVPHAELFAAGRWVPHLRAAGDADPRLRDDEPVLAVAGSMHIELPWRVVPALGLVIAVLIEVQARDRHEGLRLRLVGNCSPQWIPVG